MSLQQRFIEFAIKHQVLKFGEFTLKSGRISPYFFNAGGFQTGAALAELGQYYAEAINESGINFDVIFGPAYKGIPLCSASAIALANKFNVDKAYCFNRKEAKDHGEGGNIVGAPLAGEVLIVDDVITAGTAIRESIQMIQQANAKLAGIVVAFDRQEKGPNEVSAIEEIQQKFSIPVISIIKFDDVMNYVEAASDSAQLQKLTEYRLQYGS